MKLVVLICLFTMAMVMALPARADSSVLLPISAQLIGYEEAKRLCCYAHESNGWCRGMTPHLWALQGVVYDHRTRPVPAGALPCA